MMVRSRYIVMEKLLENVVCLSSQDNRMLLLEDCNDIRYLYPNNIGEIRLWQEMRLVKLVTLFLREAGA